MLASAKILANFGSTQDIWKDDWLLFSRHGFRMVEDLSFVIQFKHFCFYNNTWIAHIFWHGVLFFVDYGSPYIIVKKRCHEHKLKSTAWTILPSVRHYGFLSLAMVCYNNQLIYKIKPPMNKQILFPNQETQMLEIFIQALFSTMGEKFLTQILYRGTYRKTCGTKAKRSQYN